MSPDLIQATHELVEISFRCSKDEMPFQRVLLALQILTEVSSEEANQLIHQVQTERMTKLFLQAYKDD